MIIAFVFARTHEPFVKEGFSYVLGRLWACVHEKGKWPHEETCMSVSESTGRAFISMATSVISNVRWNHHLSVQNLRPCIRLGGKNGTFWVDILILCTNTQRHHHSLHPGVSSRSSDTIHKVIPGNKWFRTTALFSLRPRCLSGEAATVLSRGRERTPMPHSFLHTVHTDLSIPTG